MSNKDIEIDKDIEILKSIQNCIRANMIDLESEELQNKDLKDIEAIDRVIKYVEIAELTKIACCTAQNCEALNNAIRLGKENEDLQKELEIKDKMIDKIAEYLADIDFDECCAEIPEPCLGCSWEDYEPHTNCIKEYFRKMIEGKTND